ncbi:hypothetical protein ACFHYR_03990 [Pasteurella multocida]
MRKPQYFKSLGVALLGSLCWLSVKAQSHLFTPEQMTKIENKLIGEHKFALQWTSWDKFGTAEISRDATGLVIKGEQVLDGNSVSLFGRIKVIDENLDGTRVPTSAFFFSLESPDGARIHTSAESYLSSLITRQRRALSFCYLSDFCYLFPRWRSCSHECLVISK